MTGFSPADSNAHPFDPILDSDERLMWTGRPNHVIFVLTGIPLFILGCIWGSIDIFGFLVPMYKASGKNPIPLGFIIPFFSLHMFPLWLGILNMLRLYLVRNNTWYGFSNKRLLLRTGFWGTDFKTLDYDKISDISVNVGPIENKLGLGTIRAMSGDATRNRSLTSNSFIGIEHPYDVFKKLKEVSVDVKTDWNYPNALRPPENPGYHTQYDGDKAAQPSIKQQ
jgi:membrane protein YdbS with pleckstrin-like domain